MNRLTILKYQLSNLWMNLMSKIWNRGLLLGWYRLWLRKDEFHISYSIDPMAILTMNKKQQTSYLKTLNNRRIKIHNKTL